MERLHTRALAWSKELISPLSRNRAKRAQKYIAVDRGVDEDSEKDVGPEISYCSLPESRTPLPNRKLDCILLLSMAFFAVTNGLFFGLDWSTTTDAECDRLMHAYSPLKEAIRYDTVKTEDAWELSTFAGPPTDAREKAWNDMWDWGAFAVPLNRLAALNKSSNSGLNFRLVGAENGKGVAGLVEGFHQIHCLNLIREYIYREERDYTHDQSWAGGPKVIRHHIDHCIETVRMNLMCTADVTPFLIEQDEQASSNGQIGRPNYNVLRKCRDYGKLIEWVKEHIVFSKAGD